MPITIGDEHATSGMAKAIFDAMDKQLRPALQKANLSDAQIDKDIVPGWQSLSFAIASGVCNQLLGAQGDAPDPFWDWLSGFAKAASTNQVATYLGTHPVPTNLKGIR